MHLLARRMFQVATGLLILGGLVLVMPRAASSAAAALVQVSNTFSNPAITQPITANPNAMVILTTPYSALISNGVGTVDLHLKHPETGYVSTPYVVPAGYKLVITECDVLTETGAFYVYLRYSISGATTASEMFYLPNPGTQQFRFTSGAVYLPGANVKVEPLGTGSGMVTVHGYLVAI